MKKNYFLTSIALSCLFSFYGYSEDSQYVHIDDYSRVAITSPENIKTNKVASSDPSLDTPSSENPCTVELYSHIPFKNTKEKSFSYTPPKNCPGPWSKVVLENDFETKDGVQYDRSASIWLNGVNLFFGSTAEPSDSKWQTQSDLTEYQKLFTQPSKGFVFLPNVITENRTGYPTDSARLIFYPEVGNSKKAKYADDIVSIGGNSSFRPGYIVDSNSSYKLRKKFPNNIKQAYLDVVLQSQKYDEQWFQCVTNSLSNKLETCGNGAFREGVVYIDDQPAAIVPIFPKIYTGGVDPYLWRPATAVETLNFEPYRVNLTPFAALLSDGKSHNIAIKVLDAKDGFSVTATLLLYLDKSIKQTKGKITKNTLVATPKVNVYQDSSRKDSNIVTTSQRSYVLSGYIIDKSGHKIETTIRNMINFSNNQTWKISDKQDEQFMSQYTDIYNQETVRDNKNISSVKTEHTNWPLSILFNQYFNSKEKTTWVNDITQILNQNITITDSKGYTTYSSNLSKGISGASKTYLNPIKNMVTGNDGQNLTQYFNYSNSNGKNIHHVIDVTNGDITYSY